MGKKRPISELATYMLSFEENLDDATGKVKGGLQGRKVLSVIACKDSFIHESSVTACSRRVAGTP